jgi:hypothetical protein
MTAYTPFTGDEIDKVSTVGILVPWPSVLNLLILDGTGKVGAKDDGAGRDAKALAA